MNHYVYQIISLSPNEEGVCRIYSGLRSCEGLPEEDTEYMGSGMAIRGAIEKYGRDKFMKLIIAKFNTREEAHECETKWLEKQFRMHGNDWTKFRKFHYNLRLNEGSYDAGSMSPETREKMSAANSGENNPMFGKKFSNEHKRKMSEARIGKQPSDETRKKMSAARSGENHHFFGKQFSDEHKKKIGEAQNGEKNNNFKGLVIGTNKDNQTIVFCGKKDMKARGFNPSHISQVILGKLPHHKGFTFTRSTDPIYLQQLLDTAEFVDEESKQIIQQFLQQ